MKNFIENKRKAPSNAVYCIDLEVKKNEILTVIVFEYCEMWIQTKVKVTKSLPMPHLYLWHQGEV